MDMDMEIVRGKNKYCVLCNGSRTLTSLLDEFSTTLPQYPSDDEIKSHAQYTKTDISSAKKQLYAIVHARRLAHMGLCWRHFSS